MNAVARVVSDVKVKKNALQKTKWETTQMSMDSG